MLLAIATTLLVSCVGTVIETPSNHPANPSARAAPPQKPAAALKPGFDPFEAYPDEAATEPPPTDAPHHHHGGHSDHVMPADSGAPASAAADHAGHSPSGAPQSGQAPSKPPPSFTCPMHPEIVRDAAGRCPICGMNLVPKKPEPAHPAH